MLVPLLSILISVPALATPIPPIDSSISLKPSDISSQDKRFATALLFDFSPLTANAQIQIPGFSDPLGIGMDTGLGIVADQIYFADLLGDSKVPVLDPTSEIELPPGALHGVNILDDPEEMYFSYNGRAFDRSIFDLEKAEIIERRGLPVTSETSPLSMTSYGNVSNFHKTFQVHWTSCSALTKREEEMAKSIAKRRWPCANPALCDCLGY